MFKISEQRDRDWPSRPKPWVDFDGSSFDDVLEKLQEEWRVWDCDGGHDRTYFVGISDGESKRYFCVKHEFYANHGWDEELDERTFEVENFFEVEEIDKEQAHIPDDRDWLNISEFNYKLKKWPPENSIDKA